jgi:hypothetical protein
VIQQFILVKQYIGARPCYIPVHDMQGVTGSSPVASTTLGFYNPLKEPGKPFRTSFSGFFMSKAI